MAQLDGIVTSQDVRTNWLEMAHREKQMWKGTWEAGIKYEILHLTASVDSRYAIYNETTVV